MESEGFETGLGITVAQASAGNEGRSKRGESEAVGRDGSEPTPLLPKLFHTMNRFL